MKLITLITIILMMGLQSSVASAQSCGDNAQTLGVDILPWSLAKQFPWDNIQGYWQMGDNEDTYIRARVLSSTGNRKFLSLQIYEDGLCAKPTAKGTGYVDISEKNAVRAIMVDGQYRYQLKLGLFSARDIVEGSSMGCDKLLAASMQVVGYANRMSTKSSLNETPRDNKPKAGANDARNMLLKKVTVDLSDCKK